MIKNTPEHSVALIPFAPDHADTLVKFIVSFWRTHHSTVSDDDAKNMLTDWRKDDHRLFTITSRQQIVGFLRTHNSSPTVCWIDDIYVDLPHRGQGIAGRAITLLESALCAEGCTSFCMEVIPDNIPAMHLYHRLGYDRLSLITMRKDLEPFEAARTETIAGLPLRVKQFNDPL